MSHKAETPRIACTLKLRPTCAQEAQFRRWLWHLTAVYNWGIKTLEAQADAGVRMSKFDLVGRVNGHGRRIGVSQFALMGTLQTAYTAWERHRQGLSRRLRLKGRRQRLNSIAFSHGLTDTQVSALAKGRVAIPIIGYVRFHRQDVPKGHVGCMRVVRKASGWHLVLFIHGDRRPIERVGHGEIGIDPGFESLLTLSTGEKVAHPHEFKAQQERLAQAQKGSRKRLTARLHERIGNRKRNRNHHLSVRLVRENVFIAFSRDRLQNIRRRFGKSVNSAAHYQLRTMIAYKSRTGGTRYVEVESSKSTKVCSSCGSPSGPTGLQSLKVRQWRCPDCGSEHDRDRNAAINVLTAGRGVRLESHREVTSGIAAKKHREAQPSSAPA